MKLPGQYLYENYCLIFGTLFAPKWEGLSEESRSNWVKLERAVAGEMLRESLDFSRINCTCNSDPLGRCVLHAPAGGRYTVLRPIQTKEEVYWHLEGCMCGNCAGGTMPVHVLTLTLPSANAPAPQPSSNLEKSVNDDSLYVFVRGLHSNEWASVGLISNRDIEVSNGILWTKGRKFGGQSSASWMLVSREVFLGED